MPFAVLAVGLVDGRIARIDLLANPEKLTGLKDIARLGTTLDLQLW